MRKSNSLKERKGSKGGKYLTIEEQELRFELFSRLPIVIGILIFIVCLMGGIITAVFTEEVGTFFAWTIVGAIGGIFIYAILRILISSRVLTVLYLKKISEDIENAIKNQQSNKPKVYNEGQFADNTTADADTETEKEQ